jgi:hypothetical protein
MAKRNRRPVKRKRPQHPIPFTDQWVNTITVNGTYAGGRGLYLEVRNQGAARSYFHGYAGDKIGEPGWQHAPIGPARTLTVEQAYDKNETCRQMLREGSSPKNLSREEKKRSDNLRKNRITFSAAARQYHDHMVNSGQWIKNRGGDNSASTIRKKYIDFEGSPFANMLLHDVHDNEIIALLQQPHLCTVPIMRRGVAHFCFQLFNWARKKFDYCKSNPAAWDKDSKLFAEFGPQPKCGMRVEPAMEELQHMVAHFYAGVPGRTPRHGGKDGYITIPEMAHRQGLDFREIHYTRERGGFPGAIQARKNSYWLIPLDQAQAYAPFVNAPADDLNPIPSAILFALLTCTRISMACNLRWTYIERGMRGEPRKGIITYPPAQNGQDSGHKSGWHSNRPYVVVITPQVAALRERMQRRCQLGRVTSDFVFGHPKSLVGGTHYYNKPPSKTTAWEYWDEARTDIDAVFNKDIDMHAVRNTFGTWATDHLYDQRLIDATLGHEKKAVIENKSNTSYLFNAVMIDKRREMMCEWENTIMQLVGASADNVRLFPTASA